MVQPSKLWTCWAIKCTQPYTKLIRAMKTVHGWQDACNMQEIDRRDGNQNV